MPITPFLDGTKFDLQAKRVMGVAFEMARVALGLADRGDLATEIIAKRIIELAKAGERNPDLLCEGVLKGISRAAAVDKGPPRRRGGIFGPYFRQSNSAYKGPSPGPLSRTMPRSACDTFAPIEREGGGNDLARATSARQRSLFGSRAVHRFPFRPPRPAVRPRRRDAVVRARAPARHACFRFSHPHGSFCGFRSPVAAVPPPNRPPSPRRPGRISRSGGAQIASL